LGKSICSSSSLFLILMFPFFSLSPTGSSIQLPLCFLPPSLCSLGQHTASGGKWPRRSSGRSVAAARRRHERTREAAVGRLGWAQARGWAAAVRGACGRRPRPKRRAGRRRPALGRAQVRGRWARAERALGRWPAAAGQAGAQQLAGSAAMRATAQAGARAAAAPGQAAGGPGARGRWGAAQAAERWRTAVSGARTAQA
jgi:hypothetical protein